MACWASRSSGCAFSFRSFDFFFFNHPEEQSHKQINKHQNSFHCAHVEMIWNRSEGMPSLQITTALKGAIAQCLTFTQLMSKWLKKEFPFFVNFKSRHQLVGVPFSTNGSQEPLNQQTNHQRILSQSIKQEICVCVCVCLFSQTLCLYTVRQGSLQLVFELGWKEQTQLCWGKVDKTTKTEETVFCFCLSAPVSAQKNQRLEMYVFALWSPVAL